MIKTASLNENKLFKRLYYRGKSVVGPLMVLYYLPGPKDINRLGITTGTKLGNAVVRNRIRRRFKEAYRMLEPDISTGYNIVFVARKRAAVSDYHRIEAEMASHLEKAGLLNSFSNPDSQN